MRKTLIAAVMLGSFALQASANPGNPKKGTPEAEITQLVIEYMHAGYLTPSECADVLDEVNGYDYGIMTLSMADPNGKKNNGKKTGGSIREEEVPFSIDLGLDDDEDGLIDVGFDTDYSPGYEPDGEPIFGFANKHGKVNPNSNKHGFKVKVKKVK